MKPLLIFLLCIAQSFAYANSAKPPHIGVVGTAVSYVSPDTIEWSLQVKNIGPELSTVASQHEAIVSKVLKTLKNFAISKEKLQTTNMEFGEQFRHMNGSRVKQGYFAITNIQFTLTKPKQYQDIWHALAKFDKVSINSVNYDVEDRIAIQEKVRIDALIAAKNKAQKLAQAIDSRIGEALMIQEVRSYENYAANTMQMKSASFERGREGVESISLGKIAIKMEINAEFRLIAD